MEYRKGSNLKVKDIILIFVVALSYWVLGKIGLLLSVPPGFASAIWAPSGLSLVAILVCKKKILPGIFLGSFLLNLQLSIDSAGSLVHDSSFIIAIFIGLGASAHALFGEFLIKRFAKIPKEFSSYKEILAINLWGGPIACTLSATIGIATLYINGIILEENLLFNWVTWWFGDTIGVCIFSTILFILIRFKGKKLRFMGLTVIFPLLLSLSVFISIYFVISKYERNKINNEFMQDSEEISNQIIGYFEDNINYVDLTRAFFEGVDEIKEEQFLHFSDRLRHKNEEIKSIAWSPQVSSKNFTQINNEIKKKSINGKGIFSFNNKTEYMSIASDQNYYPLLWISPRTSKGGYGFDVSSEENRKYALSKSLDTNDIVSTKPLNLITDEKREIRSVFLAAPVKKKNILKGYIIGVFDINKIINQYLKKSNIRYNNFVVTEGGASKTILYSSSDEVYSAYLSKNYSQKDFHRSVKFKNASRDWEIWFFQTEQSMYAGQEYNTWFVQAVGVLITSLFGGLLMFFSTSSTIINNKVELRTRDLQKANEQIKKIADYKAEFLSNMSHEIRTPLNGIIGLVQLIQINGIKKENHDHFKNILSASKLLIGIVNDILDYSKIESGMMTIHKSDFNFKELVNNTINLVDNKINSDQVKLVIKISDAIPDIIKSDEVRLGQLILNLLSNAIKFTAKGSITIDINTETLEQDHYLNIKVSDTGVGISKEAQKNLFLPFSQADTSITRAYGGSGLGLSICKKMVHLLGGEMYFESVVNSGSTFGFTIKYEIGSENKIDRINLDDIPESLNILIVEDNLLNQKVLTSILEKFSHKCTIANNGLEAIEILKESTFDIIFMDIQMPVMGGVEATLNIKKNFFFSSIPIIGFSANTDEELKKTCFDAGMVDFISKPVSVIEVKNILTKYC